MVIAPPLRLVSRAARARELRAAVWKHLRACRLCLHDCGADRTREPAGRCHAPAVARVFSAQVEVGDELELLPTYAIALSGCNLRCAFCVTGADSWNAGRGQSPDLSRLAGAILRRWEMGAVKTVMILGGEPTLYPVSILELLEVVPDQAPVVLKTNACFAPDARPWFGGLVDCWLPDFKFGPGSCARDLAGVPRYWETVTDNLSWMAGDAPDLIVRHLLMPGHVECCWRPVAGWLAAHLPGVKVSLRQGYQPAWRARQRAELSRLVSASEWKSAVTIGETHGLHLIP